MVRRRPHNLRCAKSFHANAQITYPYMFCAHPACASNKRYTHLNIFERKRNARRSHIVNSPIYHFYSPFITRRKSVRCTSLSLHAIRDIKINLIYTTVSIIERQKDRKKKQKTKKKKLISLISESSRKYFSIPERDLAMMMI